MMKLLKQLIESPMTSSKLLVCDPFREHDQEELVREVIGLANADVDGPRNLLFGVNAGALEGGGIVGITENAMADLKKAHRIISALIDPVLHLAFIYDRINGKLVGTLEIDGCDDRPYIVGQNYSEKLSRGQCWIRKNRELLAVQPADLARTDTSEPGEKPAKKGKPPPLTVGFNDQPDCVLLEMDIPDTSDPPFAEDTQQIKEPLDLKQTIKQKIGTVTSRILRLGSSQKHDPAADADGCDAEQQNDEYDGSETIVVDTNNHYFFEEKAIHLNICVCNKGYEGVDNVSIKLGFPIIEDFDVVDRLYISPFDKRSAHAIKNLGYPDVEHSDDAIMVRSSIGTLTPDSPKQALKCALRLAVGPGMQGKKLAIIYRLRGPDNESLGNGRLKIKFGKVTA